jgi:hypothetical protein
MTTWLSPDCRDGNHQKCDRVAWDEEEDDGTDCGCECHEEVKPPLWPIQRGMPITQYFGNYQPRGGHTS